ncbi:glycolate oxidase subunit GlcF [Inhella sp.]|uniref:glycolate oxidase subunit GlcF n=1 Tax=Inhella sp. TaxID=1921806 RepID=UPI0035B3B8E0
MHTELAPELAQNPAAQRARELIQSCVHCGFCTATCPSYQVLGNELDSPRGRIALVRQLLQGEAASAATQQHLDRCLSCRACETTCPSGVRYGELVDLGRGLADAQAPARPLKARLLRALLARFLPSPLFGPSLRLGQWLRPLLPGRLRRAVPRRQRVLHRPAKAQPRQVLLLRGCVQPALAPNIEAATQRVLAVLGVQGVPVEGCCGALREHLGAHESARRDMQALVAACAGRSEPIVSNASGCGLMVKEYGRHLPGDAAAAAVAERTQDLGEWLLSPAHLPRLRAALKPGPLPSLAWHPPCTLQHGQRRADPVEQGLRQLGFQLQRPRDAHLCCGSAGTYSILQPAVAQELRARKLAALDELGAEQIVSANIGCISHLSDARPVRHWVEVLADHLSD